MSQRNRGDNRRARRQNLGGVSETNISQMDLPGPLKVLGNQKLFLALAAFAGLAMVVSLMFGAINGGSSNPANQPMQANEAPDAPVGTPDPNSTAGPNATPAQTVKHYSAPPPMTIDTSKNYTATIKTSKGDIVLDLDAKAAPQAVNAFVFLANDGYYDGTEFMQLVTAPDGSKFYAQAGDPTETGLGTPGFSVPKEHTDLPFDRGAIGMGGTSENSNGGQFFISFGDFPALDGKYTVFGKVTSGLDVLDSLSLLDLTDRTNPGQGDTIQSVTITES